VPPELKKFLARSIDGATLNNLDAFIVGNRRLRFEMFGTCDGGLLSESCFYRISLRIVKWLMSRSFMPEFFAGTINEQFPSDVFLNALR
jgi:hypothetical protein